MRVGPVGSGTVPRVMLIYFLSRGWRQWDVGREPLIRDGMPIPIDGDLRLEDGDHGPRATVVANRWLRKLPVSGAPSPNTWRNYATALRAWFEFVGRARGGPAG